MEIEAHIKFFAVLVSEELGNQLRSSVQAFKLKQNCFKSQTPSL